MEKFRFSSKPIIIFYVILNSTVKLPKVLQELHAEFDFFVYCEASIMLANKDYFAVHLPRIGGIARKMEQGELFSIQTAGWTTNALLCATNNRK